MNVSKLVSLVRQCFLAELKRVLKLKGLENFPYRLAAQKLTYLVQRVFKLDLGYEFMWFPRGPYSRALAKDLRKASEGDCGEEGARIRELLELIMSKLSAADLRKSLKLLEIMTSYLMLAEDVYPKPEDPVAELLKRKGKLTKEDVEEALKLLSELKELSTRFVQ